MAGDQVSSVKMLTGVGFSPILVSGLGYILRGTGKLAKRKNPSRKRKKSTPKYQQKITVDKSGRYRIGGKFASKRQIGAWKSNRKKHHLNYSVPKISKADEKSYAKVRSETSRRAAETRRQNKLGIFYAGERYFSRMGYRNQYYQISYPEKDIIEVAVNAVKKRNKKVTRILAYPFVEGLDDENDELTASEKKGHYLSVNDPDFVDRIIEEFEYLESSYLFNVVTAYFIVFTFPIGE